MTESEFAKAQSRSRSETAIAAPFFSALVGKAVSSVWRGYGSALFLEFGELVPHPGALRDSPSPYGDVSLMIEWSWRIERQRSILGGSWSSEQRWAGMFERLIGAKVTAIETFGVLPEICIHLSNGLRVSSFMTVEGQPQWAIIARNPALGNLHVRRGRMTSEPSIHRDSQREA